MHSNTTGTSNESVPLGMLKLLRVRQWVKNVFVLAPLIFTAQFLELSSVISALLAMLLFSLAASASYILNDIQDIDHDREHPVKSKTRPLASGQLQVRHALALLIALYLILITSLALFTQVTVVISIYVVLNIFYSLVLKHEPVIDIFTIASGFVLRVYAGSVALDAPLSHWMFITTLCLALYLAAIKRRQELRLNGSGSRRVLKTYTVELVDKYAQMSATGALIFYSLYVMSERVDMVFSIPLVLFGLFRYWYVVEALDKGESPTEALLTDWQLQLTILAWGFVCIWAMWPEGV